MSGNADVYEARYISKHCPDMKIVYNDQQDERVLLSAEFLQDFDRWITRNRAQKIKVLFRCNCGCHRTGRLAASYRMTYNGYSADQAIAEMNRLGYRMKSKRHRSLPFQVRAMKDHIDGKPCSQEKQYCVAAAHQTEVMPSAVPRAR